jgi:lysophospholipase L1-like esterase
MMVPLRGQFREIYRAVKRKPALAATTPIIFCEGDSWFSTPLSMNTLDWIVYPTPEDEARGVPLFGSGGLFFRAEHSGDLATDIFTDKKVKSLLSWYKGFDFDAVLLSAGGNDFVGTFLDRTFTGSSQMDAASAFATVVSTGRYEAVLRSYQRIVGAFQKAKPNVPILAHTYDYPILMGQAAHLTLANLGAIATFKRRIGPWIQPNVDHVLTTVAEQRKFAKLLIDGFEELVLRPLKHDPVLGSVFDYVDLRGTLPRSDQWFDEMHPTGSGFHQLADKLRQELAQRISPSKR